MPGWDICVSLREHLLNHRRLVLNLGPATFDKVLFDFSVWSPTYVVDAAPSSASVASPSSALPRTLPGCLMPGKRRKVTSSTSSHPNSTSLRHSVLHQYECDLRDFWLRRLVILRSRAAAYVELQDLPVLPGEDVLILSLGTGFSDPHAHVGQSKLSPGRAGKLKGKLLIVAGNYSGRHGRAFLGERQYSQAGKTESTPNIRKAVGAWIRILESDDGVRRLSDEYADKEAYFVMFTDGTFPDIRTWLHLDETVPRIGWVSFQTDSHQQDEVLYSAMNVDEDVAPASYADGDD